MRYRLRHDKLAGLLAASRLSQNHWAIRLGLGRGHWSDIVNGRHPFPSAKTRQRMLEVFGVALEELFVPDTGRTDELDFRRALAHRYEILSELGQGAMGAVHLATDRALGRLVAMKVVAPEAAAGIGTAALLTEIGFIARLQHPNILPLFDAGEAAGHPYYVMPYVREGSLRALIDRTGAMGVRDVVPLVTGIARGLAHAHERQILHCDVKPQNVLVQDGHCFVMDFGIARKLRSEAQEWAAVRTGLDFSAGTPAYVSPEQASGDRAVDQRSDVYSLACVAYEMLSGRPPFGGSDTQEIVSRRFHEPPPPLHTLVPSIGRATAAVVERALSLDPALRPESARELAEELGRSTRTPVAVGLARPVGPMSVLTRWPPAPRRLQGFNMSAFISDLRVSLRSLRRQWRFALGVILTLGLGVGLGVPVLSLTDTLFLRAPSGVRDPDRVVRLVERNVGSTGPFFTDGLTGLDYMAMTTRARALDGVAGWIVLSRSLGRGAEARSIAAGLASASFFPVLGVQPYKGRFYQPSEDVEGAMQPACVVSYAFWKSTMAGVDDALGKPLFIGDTRYTVVGVAPPGFNGVGIGKVDVWLPLRVATPEFQGHDPLLWTTDQSSWLRMVARIRPGVTLDAATAEARTIYRIAGPRQRDRALAGTFLWDPLQPGRSSLPSVSSKIAIWLSAGGALLSLLVAANLVNLFVARGAARARQTAVRRAIGGGWRDLMRLQLTEALLLAAGAAILGLLVAAPTIGTARALLMPGVEWAAPRFDLRTAAIGFAIAILVGVVVALWATVQSSRVNPADLLRGAGSAQAGDARRARLVRRTLVMVQAAVFAILLTGGTAFVKSLDRAAGVDLGFDPSRVLSAAIRLPAETPRDQARALMVRARERIAALPDVESASLSYMEPWSNNTNMPVSVPGSEVKSPYALFDFATPEYLRTIGVPMRAGRWLDASDIPSTTPVVVVNESLARLFWPHGDAIGQCMRVGADTMPCRTVVGVVRDFHVTGMADDKPMPVYWLPFAQSAVFPQRPRLLIRPRSDAAGVVGTVRRALQTLGSDLPAADVHSVADNTRWFVTPLQLGAAAFTAFGIVAAIVGTIGLYSVLSFLVIEQRRAYAIRLAVGAAPRAIGRAIVSYGLLTTAAGIVVGDALLVVLRPVLEPLLFHTRLLEPTTLAIVGGFGVLLALCATVAPARIVTRLDIVGALREQ